MRVWAGPFIGDGETPGSRRDLRVLWLIAVHALAAVLAPPLVRRLGRSAFLVLALAPAAAFGWALSQTSRVIDGHPVEQVTRWIPEYGVSLAFRLDPLRLVLLYLA